MRIENLNIEFENLSYDRVDDIFEYSSDEEFFKYLTSKPHKTKEDTKKFIDYLFDRVSSANSNTKYWFIKIKNEDKVIGTVGLLNITTKDAELAYGMSLKYAGLGYMNEVLLKISDYVFNNLKLDRLYGGTIKENKNVINTLLSMGFKEDIDKKDSEHWYYYMDRDVFLESDQKSSIVDVKIEDIVDLVGKILDEDISTDSDIDSCLNWDSLTHINIIEEISKKYSVKFKPKDVVKATSIKDIYGIINNHE